ncbi:MAG TPA: L-histidine N(alpha)-methyltransferase [Blastocatellia bacterium]|nr:L-histidine N(alpha)-methyltransferase [Blastocatellia bacterium]
MGETIHTENSYEFDVGGLADLARTTAFRLERTWFDSARRFSFNLFAAR